MSYTPSTDFLALVRTTPNGARICSVPGLDWLLDALARAGLINLWINPTSGPTSAQATTLWLKSSSTSWATEGTLFLWDAPSQSYLPATPANFAAWVQAVAFTGPMAEVVLSVSVTLTQAAGYADNLYTNANGGIIQATLPPLVDGLRYQFAVLQPQTFFIVPNSANDILQIGGRQGTQNIQSVTPGSYLRLRSAGGKWLATSMLGTWSLQ